jgi:hypothetical protein
MQILMVHSRNLMFKYTNKLIYFINIDNNMSNRNFDSRVVIQRLQNQNYARNLYLNATGGSRVINNPQNSDGDSSRFNSYIPGAQTEYFRGLLGGGETISVGGIVNIPPFLPTSAPVPAPAPAPGPTVPSAPTITLIAAGNTQLTVAFTAGSDGGSAITDYEYSTDNGITFTSVGTTSLSIVITGLINGTTYQVVIRAVNSVGTGASSSAVGGTPATIPSAPTITTITPGNTQLTVAFTAGSDGGSPIIDYLYSTDNGTTYLNAGITSSPITITGLTNGTTYDVIITALNAMGTGLLSNSVSGTPAGAPNPPTSLSGVGGNQAIYVLFTPGADNGNTITNYQYSIDGGSTFTAFSPAQTISPVLISGVGLANGTPYNVQLKAVNAIGESIASSTISVTPIVTTLLAANRLINLDSNTYSGLGTAWTNLDSGGLYSATLNGSPTYDISNPSNKYFSFNPGVTTGQFAQINQATAINPVLNIPFTIQIWVRINNIGSGGGALVSKVFGASSYDGYAFYYQSDTKLVIHENGSSQVNYFRSDTNVLSNGWALYTANIQFGNGGGRTNKIFVNGRQVVSQISNEFGIPSPTANLTFPTGFGGEGECDIGAFYYYNNELTTTQIIQNFDATKSRYGA